MNVHTFELPVPLLLLLLPELDLLLLGLTSECLLDLPGDSSLVLSAFSLFVFGSFWLGIAIIAMAGHLAYAILAKVVRQRYYTLISFKYKAIECRPCDLFMCYDGPSLNMQRGQMPSHMEASPWARLIQCHWTSMTTPQCNMEAQRVGVSSKYAALPLSCSQMGACPRTEWQMISSPMPLLA